MTVTSRESLRECWAKAGCFCGDDLGDLTNLPQRTLYAHGTGNCDGGVVALSLFIPFSIRFRTQSTAWRVDNRPTGREPCAVDATVDPTNRSNILFDTMDSRSVTL